MHETSDMRHLMQSLWFIFASLQVESPCQAIDKVPFVNFLVLIIESCRKEWSDGQV